MYIFHKDVKNVHPLYKITYYATTEISVTNSESIRNSRIELHPVAYETPGLNYTLWFHTDQLH
jgi:hypothetical protein